MKWSEAIRNKKRFDTPTRILREFVAEAEDTYKLGFLTDEPEAVDLLFPNTQTELGIEESDF